MGIQAINWLDLVIVIAIGMASIRGFQRGFFIEVGSLIALWLGVYAAINFSGHVATWFDLGEHREILSFLITFLLVLFLVHLAARALTAVIEIAMLGWANRIAGVFVAMLRSAFVLSIALNIVIAYTDGSVPPRPARERSALNSPILALAPAILPQLGETKWVRSMIEQIESEVTTWPQPHGSHDGSK